MAVQAVIIHKRKKGAERPHGGIGFSKNRDQDYNTVKAELKRDLEQRTKLKKIFEDYDANKDNKLDIEELATIMTDSTAPGTPPSTEELDFVLKVGDRNGDGYIDITELEAALIAWKQYSVSKDYLEATMKKFDKSGSGTLEKSELKAYLTELNGGLAPKDLEVDWVMQEADVIGDGVIHTQELTMATQSWYSFKNKQSAEQKKCCVVL